MNWERYSPPSEILSLTFPLNVKSLSRQASIGILSVLKTVPYSVRICPPVGLIWQEEHLAPAIRAKRGREWEFCVPAMNTAARQMNRSLICSIRFLVEEP